MKKYFFIPALFVAVLFFSCSEDSPRIYYVWDEPAIVDSLNNIPIIKTAYGKYAAPTLSSDVKKGSYLWVSFIIDEDKQTNADLLTVVTNLKYKKIGGSDVVCMEDGGPLPGNEDEYTDSIDVALLYNSYVDNVLFFGFHQQAPEDQKFEYKLIFNKDSIFDHVPTLYIKAKRIGSAAGSDKKILTHYGFDMSDFLETVDSPSTIAFNVKYKMGTLNGKDVYKSFRTKPITWNRQSK